MAKQKKQKKQKKIWVPAYDYDADGNIVVFGDAIVDAANASRFGVEAVLRSGGALHPKN